MNSLISHKHNRGFTLIELVVVIVIIGLLSSISFPRFINLTDDSRKAVLKGVNASIQSTMALVHSKAKIKNALDGAEIIEADGLFYSLFNGYPDTHNIGNGSGFSAANASGIASSIDLKGDLVITELTHGLVKSISFSYPQRGNNCAITYHQAVSSLAPPVITENYSSC